MNCLLTFPFIHDIVSRQDSSPAIMQGIAVHSLTMPDEKKGLRNQVPKFYEAGILWWKLALREQETTGMQNGKVGILR